MSGLPIGWAETTLGDISEPKVDQGGPDRSEGSFCYVDISSIDRSTKRVTNPQQLPTDAAPSRAKQRLLPGDVLVSMTRPNLNAVAIVTEDLANSIGSTGFHVLRSRSVSSLWTYYRVQAFDFISAMSMKVQGALYPAVRPNDIAQFATSVPPRPEQDRIVDEIEKQFTRLDAATAALKRVQANLKRYRASVLKAACEGRLVPTEAELARKEGRDYEPADQLLQRILRERRARWEADTLAKMIASDKPPKDDRWKGKYKEPSPPDTSNLPELPEGWCWANLDQLSVLVRNGISTKPEGETGTPILRISAVRPLRVDFRDVRFLPDSGDWRDYELNAGNLLFTRYNGNRDFVGVCGMVRAMSQTTVHPDKLIRIVLSDSELAPYVEIVTNAGASRLFIESRIRTTAGQSGVSGGDVRQLPIPLAPFAEQMRIVSEVDRSLTAVLAVEAQVLTDDRRIEALRQSILARAFSGRLVEQDPADEPASVLLERIRATNANNEPRGSRRPRAPASELVEVGYN